MYVKISLFVELELENTGTLAMFLIPQYIMILIIIPSAWCLLSPATIKAAHHHYSAALPGHHIHVIVGLLQSVYFDLPTSTLLYILQVYPWTLYSCSSSMTLECPCRLANIKVVAPSFPLPSVGQNIFVWSCITAVSIVRKLGGCLLFRCCDCSAYMEISVIGQRSVIGSVH